MNQEQVQADTSSFVGTETKTRAPSDRKILVVVEGGFKEFDTKGAAAKFINEIGAENVTGIYTGAKPGSLKTKVSL